MRFLSLRDTFHHEDAHIFTNINYENEMMVVGVVTDGDTEHIISSSAYYKSGSGMAEYSITISPQWQQKGIGGHLLQRMIDIAAEKGVKGFEGEVLAENTGMLKLLNDIPFRVSIVNYADTFEFSFRFSESLSRIR